MIILYSTAFSANDVYPIKLPRIRSQIYKLFQLENFKSPVSWKTLFLSFNAKKHPNTLVITEKYPFEIITSIILQLAITITHGGI